MPTQRLVQGRTYNDVIDEFVGNINAAIDLSNVRPVQRRTSLEEEPYYLYTLMDSQNVRRQLEYARAMTAMSVIALDRLIDQGEEIAREVRRSSSRIERAMQLERLPRLSAEIGSLNIAGTTADNLERHLRLMRLGFDQALEAEQSRDGRETLSIPRPAPASEEDSEPGDRSDT